MKKRILYIGNDLTINSFTATYISFFSKVLKKEGYAVRTASNKNNKALRLLEMLGLIMKYHKSTDVVLIDTYGALNFYYAYMVGKACQFFDLEYIPILHGGNLPERITHSPKFSKSLFGNAKMNVAPSKFLYDVFVNAGFSNTQIIPNSVELKKYPFKNRLEFNPKLLWVRRFQNRYNPMMAVEVLEQLKQHFPKASLCMVGPEKDGALAKCKAFAEKNNLDVKFTGKLRKKEWAKLSVNYDIFLNTTNIDNTPISVIEAMALGLSIVSTDVGGMHFLIENNKDGLLVPSHNKDKMVSAILYLLNNQKKANLMTLNAREKVDNFDWELIKNKWNLLLQ
ncbi:Glycosyltransferase involved in cell wall bisynthesis [Gillisia sp. Hel1_33_143]|uniref:glycosyltransferase family 4 protein n=1 Tax=Gillisia sp. Hel1_33_143 TaxID=1336796 RepID=UPI000879E70B|nr:glycosyltransferase family 4 protein [Gillisia sp. Hel1_33_143]SDS24600.1 Glycosyltransferase involved in cell wall bisynthesis [Gillisia sp. Hel1_33_143]